MGPLDSRAPILARSQVVNKTSGGFLGRRGVSQGSVGRYPGPDHTENALIRVRSALPGGGGDARSIGQRFQALAPLSSRFLDEAPLNEDNIVDSVYRGQIFFLSMFIDPYHVTLYHRLGILVPSIRKTKSSSDRSPPPIHPIVDFMVSPLFPHFLSVFATILGIKHRV